MDALTRSIRHSWDAFAAVALVYAAITIYLGPAGFFLASFLHGCGYIIHTALKR